MDNKTIQLVGTFLDAMQTFLAAENAVKAAVSQIVSIAKTFDNDGWKTVTLEGGKGRVPFPSLDPEQKVPTVQLSDWPTAEKLCDLYAKMYGAYNLARGAFTAIPPEARALLRPFPGEVEPPGAVISLP